MFIEEKFGIKYNTEPFHSVAMGYDDVPVWAGESDVGKVDVVLPCEVRERALDEVD